MIVKIKNFLSWIFVAFCVIMALGMALSGGILSCILMLFVAIISLPIKRVQKIWEHFLGNSVVEDPLEEKPAKFWQIRKRKEQKERAAMIERQKSRNILKPAIIVVVFCVSLSLGVSATDSDNSSDSASTAYENTPSKAEEDIVSALAQEETGSYDIGQTEDYQQAKNETNNQENADTFSETLSSKDVTAATIQQTVTLDNIPEYSGTPYIAINDNVPFFTDADLTTTSFETYSDLDSLGRCGVAFANIGQDIMPTEERGSIGSIKPTGWHTVKYDIVDGNYLYNRCHLIGYQLSGENANEKNLITGTRYLNMVGMLPFEDMVTDYVTETNNHVLYRVTPVFNDDNLVASGVLMEAISVEDDGNGITFNVYCYNVQPGIEIDYSTGDSWLEDGDALDGSETANDSESTVADNSAEKASNSLTSSNATYILNTNTKKFHRPSCSKIDQMSEKNKQEYTGNRDDLIDQGYSPCKVCNP